jgi:hypothetical protein
MAPASRPGATPCDCVGALDHGVRVVIAHCASLGEDQDEDRGHDGPRVSSFSLFSRLMGEQRYARLLFGDISAINLRNRDLGVIRHLLEREDWHPRLLFGTDYPLPGYPAPGVGAPAGPREAPRPGSRASAGNPPRAQSPAL